MSSPWTKTGRDGLAIESAIAVRIEFIGLERFEVEFLIAKKTVFGLLNRFFLGEWAEFPVNVDKVRFRNVFEWRDDTVTELTGRGSLELERFHLFDDSTVGR